MIKLIEREPSLEFIIPVLKWLKNPESVSREEREASDIAAYDGFCATDDAAFALASTANTAANANDVDSTEKHINECFAIASLTREEVESELFIPLPVKETEPVNDAVQNPKHYELFEDTQVIEIIASSMSTEAFHGYCLGNVLKYRLRAGNKDNTIQELAKADKYKELYEDFKHLCK